jgi:hypothetical protein
MLTLSTRCRYYIVYLRYYSLSSAVAPTYVHINYHVHALASTCAQMSAYVHLAEASLHTHRECMRTRERALPLCSDRVRALRE